MMITMRNISIAVLLTLLFSSPSYAGFWDFMKVKKKDPTTQQEAVPVEAVVTPDKAAEESAAKQAEAAKTAEASKKAELAKQAEAQKAAEANKQADASKAAELAKQAEAQKAVEANKQADALKAAELAKQAEAQKAVEANKQADTSKAAELAKQAEAQKAVEANKQAEAQKAVEANKQADALKAAELAKQAEAQKVVEANKQADALKAAELAKQAEAQKAVKAAEVSRQAEAAKAAELAKKAEAEKIAKATEAAELAKKVEAEKAAKAAAAVPAKSAPVVASGKFTSVGADMAGNADGSIPAWSGSMNGVPAGLTYSRSGDSYPDPYAKEQPLFTIHAGNVDQYAERVSEGLKALIKKYPDTFFMNVYPSHRDGKLNDLWVQRTIWNSTRTKLVNGIDGLNNYTGGIPFPYPKSAAEVMWNGRLAHPNPTLNGKMDDMAVYLNGNNQMRRQEYTGEFPFSNKGNALGVVDDKIGINAAFILVTVEKPDRQKGQMTIVHEALDQVRGERKAWVYIPGSRRVRRAPTVGFDTPDGPGGLVTVDDSLGFNGAMVRYDWKLLGKREIYIPYNNYKFDDPKVDYATLLMAGHVNPDYMRYELHRVWVVEATLKSGQRHVYAKRRFYLDEDSWQIVVVESYDGRGNLWRVGILNTLYDYLLKGYIARAQVYHDLQSGAYIAQRLVNETGQMRLMDMPKGENFYSPSNLRTMGK